jgi:hypothetical protein
MSLISTADLRVWLGIEEGDKTPNAKLLSLIDSIQDFVDNYTNRTLEAKVYRTDPDNCYYDGNGRPWIYAKQYPLSYVSEVAIDSDREFGSASLVASADFYWYPNGKIRSEDGYFTRGHRNVRLDYIAGFAPVVGGTHNAAVSSYPIPGDLKQVMVEMCVESFKEGMTSVHTVMGVEQPKLYNLLKTNTFWMNTLNKYKSFDNTLFGADE